MQFISDADTRLPGLLASIIAPGGVWSMVPANNGVMAMHDKPTGKTPGQFIRTQWTFEADSLVPSRIQLFIGKREDPDKPPLTRLVASESYEWKEHEGVFVPTSIIGQRATVHTFPDGKVEEYTLDTEVRFTWHSINEGIPGIYFDRETLRDEAKLVRFLSREESLEQSHPLPQISLP